eukprot:Gb_16965 [translate_table: standard]
MMDFTNVPPMPCMPYPPALSIGSPDSMYALIAASSILANSTFVSSQKVRTKGGSPSFGSGMKGESTSETPVYTLC